MLKNTGTKTEKAKKVIKELGYEVSDTDSFKSDSDFEDLIDDVKTNEDIHVEPNEEIKAIAPKVVEATEFAPKETGYKKKAFVNHMKKRYKRKAQRSCCGKICRRLSRCIAKSCIGELVVQWYKSLYSGLILMFISIGNLMTIPYLQYYDEIENLDLLGSLVRRQMSISIIYLLDIIVLLSIHGIRDVFMKRSWAIRIEIAFQVYFLYKL